MRRHPIFKWVFGIGMCVFCIAYITVSIRIPFIQLRDQYEQEKMQSPVYREQLLLKDKTRKFANSLKKLADNYMKDPTDSNMQWINNYSGNLDTITGNLFDEGVDIKPLQILGQKAMTAYPLNSGKVDALRAVAKELNRIADQLPKITAFALQAFSASHSSDLICCISSFS